MKNNKVILIKFLRLKTPKVSCFVTPKRMLETLHCFTAVVLTICLLETQKNGKKYYLTTHFKQVVVNQKRVKIHILSNFDFRFSSRINPLLIFYHNLNFSDCNWKNSSFQLPN